MNSPEPVFIADTCIGGLSVVKSMWGSGHAANAFFMADYEVNPLGVTDESAIAEVVSKWFSLAAEHSDTLVIACNTLSIRYRQLPATRIACSGLRQIVSMVDCFEAMVETEASLLADRKVLIIGTAFTARQSLYPEILKRALPGAQVTTAAATELERRIARFLPWNREAYSVLGSKLRQAIENSDITVLACTCFPMASAELEQQFPGVVFIDPGVYCARLLDEDIVEGEKNLSLLVKGDVVSRDKITEYARSYLGNDFKGL